MQFLDFKTKNILFSAIMTIGFCYTAQAQKFVNEFLNIGVSAKAHGMANSMVANVNDGTAGYWNAAGLTDLESPFQINAMHSKWFGGISNFDYFSVAKKFKGQKTSVGAFSFIRLGVDNIANTIQLYAPDGSINYDRVSSFSVADYAGIFSYAQALDEAGKMSFGGSFKIIHRSTGSFAKAWGFGMDAGFKYRMDKFLIGISARDITTTYNTWSFSFTEEEKRVFNQTGNIIPVRSSEFTLPRLILGGAYFGTKSKVGYLIETNLVVSTDGRESAIISSNRFAIDPSLGVELDYLKRVYLRFGMGNVQMVQNPIDIDKKDFEFLPALGLGLKLGRLKVDYALSNVGNASGVLVSHIFSARLDFIPRSE